MEHRYETFMAILDRFSRFFDFPFISPTGSSDA
jgi:hypothetical protein